MKKPIFVSSLAIASYILATTGWADGLIYNLPDDGMGVKYELLTDVKQEDGSVSTISGTITICSVGRVYQDMKHYRWIEIRSEAGAGIIVDKLLIPERHLGEGQNPLKHVVRGMKQITQPGRDPVTTEIDLKTFARDDRNVNLRFFLRGPYPEARPLPEKIIDTPEGQLKCRGISATELVKPPRRDLDEGSTIQITENIFISDEIPFGVVAYSYKWELTRDAKTIIMTSKGTLKSIIHDKKSDIQDGK